MYRLADISNSWQLRKDIAGYLWTGKITTPDHNQVSRLRELVPSNQCSKRSICMSPHHLRRPALPQRRTSLLRMSNRTYERSFPGNNTHHYGFPIYKSDNPAQQIQSQSTILADRPIRKSRALRQYLRRYGPTPPRVRLLSLGHI